MKAESLKKSESALAVPHLAPSRVRAPWLIHGLVLLGLFVANFGLYHGTLDLGFFSVDDADYIQNNPYIANFHAENVKHILTTPYFANYAPANLLSYSLDVALAGGKVASSMHLSNVMWHGWVVCMVYLLALAMSGETLAGTAAACLFLFHPAHVEVVAWLSSRKDLVATGFAVLSMTCYLFWRRCLSRGFEPPTVAVRRWRDHLWYLACLFCFL